MIYMVHGNHSQVLITIHVILLYLYFNVFIGHHAAMYVRQDEAGDQRNLNVEWVINYWINLGSYNSNLFFI